MSDEKKPQPKKRTEATAPELQELQDMFNTVGRPIIIGVLVILVGLLVVNKIRASRASAEDEASRLLSNSRSQADLETIISDYGKTRAAPQATLALAKLHYRQGRYLPAIEQYETFLATYPHSEQVPAAELGRLLCKEAQNASAETAAALLAFATAHPDSYLTPQALLAQARCLEAIGQRDEARTVLEDMTKTYEDKGWDNIAEEALDHLKMDAQREKNPMPVPEGVQSDGTAEAPAPMVAIPGPADTAPTATKPPAPGSEPTPTPAAHVTAPVEAAPPATAEAAAADTTPETTKPEAANE